MTDGGSTVVTERLVLNRLTLDEARALVAHDRRGRAWAPDYPTDEDVLIASIACEAGDHYDESGPFGVYQVRLRATGDAVGGIGFIHPPEEGEVEVGYGLSESVRGQGLATEALRAVTELAVRHGARLVVATTAPGNTASQRVLERVGFVRDGEVVTDEGVSLRWVHPG